MLVLSRYVDQEIVIGDKIIIKVKKIRGRAVHLGITAPRDIEISRPDRKPKPAIDAIREGQTP